MKALCHITIETPKGTFKWTVSSEVAELLIHSAVSTRAEREASEAETTKATPPADATPVMKKTISAGRRHVHAACLVCGKMFLRTPASRQRLCGSRECRAEQDRRNAARRYRELHPGVPEYQPGGNGEREGWPTRHGEVAVVAGEGVRDRAFVL